MPPFDRLSVAANVLQIIGFSDSVFRIGKSLYELFEKAGDASRNIPLLLLDLQALLSVVTSVRVFVTKCESSPFAHEDCQPLPNIHTILTLIEQEFYYLRGIPTETLRSGRGGWLSLLFTNVRWGLRDYEIADLWHRLAQYTQNLNAALSVSGL